MKNQPTEQSRFSDWRERHFGLAVAVPAVLAMLGGMALIHIQDPKPPEPLPMKVLVLRETPPPTPEPRPEPEPTPEAIVTPPPEPLEPLAATRQDSQEDGDEILDPVPPQESEPVSTQDIKFPEPESAEVPASIEDWAPTDEEAALLAQLREEAQQRAAELQQRQSELQEFVVREEVKSAARQFELDSDGGLNGAMRMLELDHFPKEIVIPVLRRYGIRTERRYTSPTAGRGFVNGAITEDGTYTNVEQAGYYEVMTLSAKALNFMATAETEAMMEEGYDPRNSRVRTIVFTIIKTDDDQYELGVSKLEVEKIR